MSREVSVDAGRHQYHLEGVPAALVAALAAQVGGVLGSLDQAYRTTAERLSSLDCGPATPRDARLPARAASRPRAANPVATTAPSKQWSELLSRIQKSLSDSPASSDGAEPVTWLAAPMEDSCPRAVLAVATFLRATAGTLEDIAEDLAEDDEDLLPVEVEDNTARAYQLSRSLLRHLEEDTWPQLIEDHRAKAAPAPLEVPSLNPDPSQGYDRIAWALSLVRPFQAFLRSACSVAHRDVTPCNVSQSNPASLPIDLGLASPTLHPAVVGLQRAILNLYPPPSWPDSPRLDLPSLSDLWSGPKASAHLPWKLNECLTGSGAFERLERDAWDDAEQMVDAAEALDPICGLQLLKTVKASASVRGREWDPVAGSPQAGRLCSAADAGRGRKVATMVERWLTEFKLMSGEEAAGGIPEAEFGFMLVFFVPNLLSATDPPRSGDWKEDRSLHSRSGRLSELLTVKHLMLRVSR